MDKRVKAASLNIFSVSVINRFGLTEESTQPVLGYCLVFIAIQRYFGPLNLQLEKYRPILQMQYIDVYTYVQQYIMQEFCMDFGLEHSASRDIVSAGNGAIALCCCQASIITSCVGTWGVTLHTI